MRALVPVVVGLWIVGMLGPAHARAYEHVTTKDGVPAHWDRICVSWWLNEWGSDDLPMAELEAILKESFAAWSAVEEAYVEPRFDGYTCFDEVTIPDWPGEQNLLVWREGEGSWPYAVGVVALTSVTFDSRRGTLIDADIEFNGEGFAFATDGSPFAYDLQQTATHEIGHMLGLAHSDDENAVMFAQARPGEDGKRDLREDDRQGLAASHPIEEAPEGTGCDPSAPVTSLDAPFCPEEPDGGCGAAGGSAPWLFALLLGAGHVVRRRRSKADRVLSRGPTANRTIRRGRGRPRSQACTGDRWIGRRGSERGQGRARSQACAGGRWLGRRGSAGILPAKRAPAASGILVLVATFGLLAPTARAGNPFVCQLDEPCSGTPIHWTTDDLSYTLDPDLPEDFDPDTVEALFDEAFSPWTDFSCQPISITGRGYEACPAENAGDGKNCIFWTHDRDEWESKPYGSPSIVALTLVHYRTGDGVIVDVDTDYNAAHVTWSTTPECSQEHHDLLAVATHEAGHFVGLDHSEDEAATMYGDTFPGDCDKRTLHPDDEETFCQTYETFPIAPEPEPPPDTGHDAGSSDVSGHVGPEPVDPRDDVRSGRCGIGGGPGPLGWLLTLGLLATLARRRGRGRAPAR